LCDQFSAHFYVSWFEKKQYTLLLAFGCLFNKMKRNKIVLYGLWLLLLHSKSFANLIYHPVSFVLSTDKESYYEGEKITFYITITNNDKERTHPVLLPHTQNTGEKLFYLTAYDKAKNTLLLRYTENKQMNMMVHDTGTVQIKYLKPQEQIVVPIYLNDFENYYSYHTQNASHHSFGVPLFAGIYHINVTYNPKGLALGDSLYTYYDYFDKYSAPANNYQRLQPIQIVTTSLVCCPIVSPGRMNISTAILLICMRSTLADLKMEISVNTENFQIGVRATYLPNGTMSLNKKHIMNCNCPIKDFTAFLITNREEEFTKNLIVRKMALCAW